MFTFSHVSVQLSLSYPCNFLNFINHSLKEFFMNKSKSHKNTFVTSVFIISCGLFLLKSLSAITNYCHLSRKKEKKSIKYKKQTWMKYYEKKDMFWEVLMKTVSETASLMSVGSKFHRLGPKTEKALSPAEGWDFGMWSLIRSMKERR